MAGWDTLGAVLGDALGGGTGEAYAEGRLRTAQTENALSNARLTQLKATAAESEQKARENLRSHAAELGIDPRTLEIMDAGLGSEFHSTMQGNEIGQSMGFRDVVADPNTPNNVRQYNLAAISGKPFSPLESVGEGAYTDITAADPSLTVSPIGQATIGAKNAQAAADYARANKTADEQAHPERYRSALIFDPNKPYIANPDYDPTITDPEDPRSRMVIAVTGGKADPNVGPALGSRERGQVSTVLHGGLEAAQRIETIMKMPSTANAGILGGGAHKVGMLDAIAGNLQWGLASEDVNNYNSVMAGVARNLANLENYGRAAPSEGQIGSLTQQLTLRPDGTETVGTKMLKMADLRNIVENSIHTFLAFNPNVPDAAKGQAKAILAQVQAAVPFTMNDVIALQQSKNKRLSLHDLMQQRMLTNPVKAAPAAAPGAAPAAAPAAAPVASFSTEAEAAAAAAAGKIQSGDKITVGGVSGTWH